MITGLFETHLSVRDLERSIAFYRDVLELELGHLDDPRRAAFFWIGGRGEAMLGLWEKPEAEIQSQHMAFRASIEDVRDRSNNWLAERNLSAFNFLMDGTNQPMVFAWMPAISIYFHDPDGHLLEFIAMLPDPPRPELGVVSWEDWQSNRMPLLEKENGCTEP